MIQYWYSIGPHILMILPLLVSLLGVNSYAAVAAMKPVLTASRKKNLDHLPTFLKPTASVASRAPCSDMDDWKKRNGHPPHAKVFICSGGYFDLRDALVARGWVENPDKDSLFYDLHWGMAPHIKHDSLQPHQIVNHYCRSLEITTKVGLTLNVRNSQWYICVDADT